MWVFKKIEAILKSKGLDISTSSDIGEFRKLIKLLNSINDIHNCKERIPNQGEHLFLPIGQVLIKKSSARQIHQIQI